MKHLAKILIAAMLLTLIPGTGLADQYISTGNATVTGDTTATLTGTINDPAHYSAGTAWLGYGTLLQAFPGVVYANPDTSNNISHAISGLTPGTTYHYRLCGYFPHAQCGDIKTFTTTLNNVAPPSSNTPSGLAVDTYPANTITDTTAVLRGVGIPDPANPTTVYFRYSEMPVPPVFCNDIYGTNMSSTDDIALPTFSSFSQTVTGLNPDTTYYFCAVGSTKKEIVYGGNNTVLSFTTLPCPTCNPSSLTTKPATFITKNSATLNGFFNTKQAINIWFEYAKLYPDVAGGLGTKTPAQSFGANSSGPVYFDLNGLKENSIYRFRVAGQKADGTKVYGSIKAFVAKTTNGTNPCDPVSPYNPNIISHMTTSSVERVFSPSEPPYSPISFPISIGTGIPVIGPSIHVNGGLNPLPIISGDIGSGIFDDGDPCNPVNPPPRPYHPVSPYNPVNPVGPYIPPGGGTPTPGGGAVPGLPPDDAIVHFHEGVETVFVRQIMKNTQLAALWGYQSGQDLTLFADDLAHTLATDFGYYENGREIRVSLPDIAAYELKLNADNTVTVNEYFGGFLISSRKYTGSLKTPPNGYEYNYKKF